MQSYLLTVVGDSCSSDLPFVLMSYLKWYAYRAFLGVDNMQILMADFCLCVCSILQIWRFDEFSDCWCNTDVLIVYLILFPLCYILITRSDVDTYFGFIFSMIYCKWISDCRFLGVVRDWSYFCVQVFIRPFVIGSDTLTYLLEFK